MIEISVTVVIVAIAAAVALPSVANMVEVEKRNQALSLANLTLREQRTIALEHQEPRMIVPGTDTHSIQIHRATRATSTSPCVAGALEATIEMPAIVVGGADVCFTAEGGTDTTAPAALTFDDASVTVYTTGTLKWDGAATLDAYGDAQISLGTSTEKFALQ